MSMILGGNVFEHFVQVARLVAACFALPGVPGSLCLGVDGFIFQLPVVQLQLADHVYG